MCFCYDFCKSHRKAEKILSQTVSPSPEPGKYGPCLSPDQAKSVLSSLTSLCAQHPLPGKPASGHKDTVDQFAAHSENSRCISVASAGPKKGLPSTLQGTPTPNQVEEGHSLPTDGVPAPHHGTGTVTPALWAQVPSSAKQGGTVSSVPRLRCRPRMGAPGLGMGPLSTFTTPAGGGIFVL